MTARRQPEHEDGFMLVALIVAIFLILLALSVAAPRMAMELKREREVEAAHRANEYVRAIQIFYQKFHRYPGTLEQLEKTNNQRFLRQRYVDPFTGEANWKIIHQGEQKTTVKGFFGEDLPGLPGGLGGAANLGSAAGSASSTGGAGSTTGNSSGSSFGGTGSSGSGSAFGGSSSGSGSTFGGSSSGSGSAFGGSGSSGSGSSFGSSGSSGSGSSFGSGSNPATASGFGTSTPGSGVGSQSATSFTGNGGVIMGVGTVHSGDAILTVNEQTNYQDWEFLYDPRIEQLKAKVTLTGGGMSSGGSSNGLGTVPGIGGFGTNPGTSGFGATPGAPTSGTGTSSPTGTTPATGTPPQ